MRAQAGLTLLTVAMMLFALVTPSTHGEDHGIPIVPETETVKRIRAALDGPVSEEFKPEERKGPLHKIIKRISELHQIPIEFDNKAMGDAGVQNDIPVVFSSAKVPLRSLLRMMLRPNELTTIVRDERLMVTTNAAADDVAQNGTIRIYEVGDLCSMATRQNRFRDSIPEFGGDALVQLIQQSIVPPWWSTFGGQGTARTSLVDRLPILVVSNTEDIQDEVVNLLGHLRASRACQVKPDPCYEQEVGGVPVSFGKSLHYPWRKQLQALHDFKTIEKIELQELPKQFGRLFDLPIELDTRFGRRGSWFGLPAARCWRSLLA